MKNKVILMSILVLIMSLFVGVVAAQDDDTATDTDRPRREHVLLGEIVDIVTEATGLTAEEIMQQLRDGATLTEVIENAGGDVDAIMAEVEALVDTRIEELFNTEFEFVGPGGGFRDRIQNGVIGEIASAISEATGLEVAEILQQVRDGATLAEIITENGGDVDAVIASVVETITNTVNERVANGEITQERADMILTNLEQNVTDWINGERPFPNRPNRGGRGNN